jgi:hypothetical protein
MKQIQHIRIRFEQARHVPRGADMERSEIAVSDRVRKKCLPRTQGLPQCRKGLWMASNPISSDCGWQRSGV